MNVHARDLLGRARQCAADANDVRERLGQLKEHIATNVQKGHAEIARARGHVMAVREAQQQAANFVAMGQVAGTVAHDLNNLLTVILSYGGAALEKADDEANHHNLVQIVRAAQHAALLTRQILRNGRGGVRSSSLAIVDVDEVVEAVRPMLARLLGGSVILETALAGRGGFVRVHAGEIEQVLFNLVVNARDAMRADGTVRIETARVDRPADVTDGDDPAAPVPCIMLAVHDTGSGMDEETLAHVFDPFFTTKSPDRATGLGLATVSRIAKDGGGHFELETGVGRGSSVRLYFPRLGVPTAPAPDGVARPIHAAAKERVLLVEDDDNVRQALTASLETLGYRVVATSSPTRAIAICEQSDEPIDLLLTDVEMPLMSGRQLAAIASNVRPGIKVLFTSGLGETALADRRDPGDETLLLEKPFTMATLADRVRQALDTSPPRP